jgi:hypothetical protein
MRSGSTAIPAPRCCRHSPALVSPRHGADTVLTGLLDRSAPYGVLAEIEALGLDLVEVRHLTPQGKSPESGDRCSP